MFFLLSLEQVQMGRSVVISGNNCVNALHVTQLNSKERLKMMEAYKDRRAALWLGLFSLTVGVICNMWFYFILHHFGNSLGSVYICVYICYYYYFSIPLLDLCSWIPFSSFIFLEVVQNTFGEVNETICNFFCLFFSFPFGRWSKAIWRQ